MRRFIAATLTTALVVIGFSAVLIGTASASTPLKTVDTAACSEARNTLANAKAQLAVIKLKIPVVQVDITAGEAAVTAAQATVNSVCSNNGGGWGGGGSNCTIDQNPRVPGCQNSGPIYGGGNGSWNDRLDGRYFRLDRGPALDVCSADSYSVFLSRNGVYRDRISRYLDDRRFSDLRRSDCAVTVTNDGDCTTVTTYYNNYRNSVTRWNDLSSRYNNRDLVQRYRGDLDSAARDRLRWADEFNRTRSTVHTTCNVPTTLNTIIVQAPPVTYALPAAAAPSDGNPTPLGSSGQVSVKPSGGAETGDGSTLLR